MKNNDLSFNSLVLVNKNTDNDDNLLKKIGEKEENIKKKSINLNKTINIKNDKSNIIDNDDDNDNGGESGTINNWTDGNNDTLRNWKLSLEKAKTIYEFSADILRQKLNKMDTAIQILNGLTIFISTVVTALAAFSWASQSNINIIIIFVSTTLTALISFINFVLNQIIKNQNIKELIEAYSVYYEKLDQLNSTISGQLVLSPILREDAVEFIKREYEHYLNLIKQSPKISSELHKQALKHYSDVLENNNLSFKFAQKYNSDAMIEVV